MRASAEDVDLRGMDFTLLPTSVQPQLAQMSINEGIVATLPKPASAASATPTFGPAVKLDLSAEAQAILAGGGPNSPDPSQDSAPGPGWEVSYDPGAQTTSNDQAPQLDYSWAYNG